METFDHALFLSSCKGLGISLSSEVVDRLEEYARLLVQRNKEMNLTAITSPEGIAIRHFADSLSLLSVESILPANPSVADVGTGAGFPLLPLLIARPGWNGALIDSLGKRIRFLEEVIANLRLEEQASTYCLRAEEAGKDELRESFDLVVARAVKALPTLLEYTLPLVKVGGLFVAWKGSDCQEELASAENALVSLGGEVEQLLPITLAPGEERSLILIRKTKETNKKYPRSNKEIAKRPL